MRFNDIALRKAKTVYNFGLSECNRVIDLYINVCKCFAMQHQFFMNRNEMTLLLFCATYFATSE